MSERACEKLHTPAPSGYLQWHDWAHRMSKTHRQTQCPICGLWAVWTPKSDDSKLSERPRAE